MKKTLTVILATVLCVLMALPFAMMTSADVTVTVPTRPTASATADKVYISFDSVAGVTAASGTGGPQKNPTS